MTPEKRRGSSQKMASSLVALSSAAVLTVYAAGYLRTRPAAQRFAVESAQRRTESPAPPSPAPTSAASAPPQRTVSTRAVSSGAVSPRPAPTSTAVPNAEPAPASTESSTVPPSSAPVAVETTSPTVPEEEPRTAEYKDGTYLGWGSCRHGDIQASVVIEGGRIVSAGIAQCLTRYSCSWIAALPGQVVSRQSTNVDYVSGATQSVDAFADAVADALAKAK
jgi:uncharacterized protein with FMN-binding domain